MDLEVFAHHEEPEMPTTVLRAVEMLYFNVIFGLAFLLFNFSQIWDQGDFGIQLFSLIISGFLAYKIENRSQLFRFLLIAALLHAIPTIAMHALNIFEGYTWVATFYVAQVTLQIGALALLLSPSATAWFKEVRRT